MGQMGAMSAVMGLQAGTSLVSGFSNAASLKASGVYQKSVADTNAAMARLSASEVTKLGDYMASKRDVEGRRLGGTQRVDMAGGGVDVSSGTALQVTHATDADAAFDENMIRNNAARKAWGYEVQAQSEERAGEFAKMTAEGQARSTLLTAGLNAVEGPLSTYANYLRWARWMGGGEGGQSQTPNIPMGTKGSSDNEFAL